ncbi:ribosomal protein S18-alanine N-acetyltransferase [Kiloniella sp. b19]|uniref:ribosomal protein S18-alanine N-acetyltransferase n=1 Tax=Kiloniella sp. GXU_MW_B19 TaxID=3141326 RepID=UPI0031E0D5C2
MGSSPAHSIRFFEDLSLNGEALAGLCAALHASGFPDGLSWSAKSFRELFAMSGVVLMTVESQENEPAGFLLLQTVADEAEILTFCIHPQFRRRGLGRKLLEAMADFLRGKSICRILLEVDVENRAAKALYKDFGFRSISTRKGYYSKNGQPCDADIMEIIVAK